MATLKPLAMAMRGCLGLSMPGTLAGLEGVGKGGSHALLSLLLLLDRRLAVPLPWMPMMEIFACKTEKLMDER